MNKMPYKIKEKLRQLQKAVEKVSSIQYELTEMFEKHDMDIDLFTALADVRVNERTEALSYILNDECNDVSVEQAIDEIEEVFLIHVKRKETL